MGFDKLMAFWWDFWQTPYYKVYVEKGNKIVQVFNQKVISSVKGSGIALIDKSNKRVWWITDNYLIHGARIIFHVDVNNAVPLIINEEKEFSGNLIIKEHTIRKFIIDDKKQKIDKKSGDSKVQAEISFPPEVLFEKIEAHFVGEVMSEPPSKWAELKWVFVVLIIAGAFLLYQLMTSGIGKGGIV